jgi:indolepyruvate ferredoxin oxidoreductase beta subunit
MMDAIQKNLVLCGVGGQGTVLASKLLAAAAMEKGLTVMSAETIGMAQRGGNVFSNIRIGQGLHAPMIRKGEADLILGFEPGETVRMLPFLKKGGAVVTNLKAVMPTTATLSGSNYSGEQMVEYLMQVIPQDRLFLVDGESICRELGSTKCLNVVLLGAAVATGEVGLTQDDVLAAIRKVVPARFLELNEKAFAAGTRVGGNEGK